MSRMEVLIVDDDLARSKACDIVIEYIEKPLTFQKLEDLQDLDSLSGIDWPDI